MKLFSLVCTYSNELNERPKQGYKLYQYTPEGLKIVVSRRNKPLKWQSLEKVLQFTYANFKGYSVQLKVFGYEGELSY